jgi:hypothetical protein
MSFDSIPPGLRPFEVLLKVLSPEARSSYSQQARRRIPGGATLRPGPATPLWYQLVAEVRPFLKQRGEKAQLARLLGVHRQAVNEYFVSRTRMPDAERTLLLQEWLRARRSGKRPGW